MKEGIINIREMVIIRKNISGAVKDLLNLLKPSVQTASKEIGLIMKEAAEHIIDKFHPSFRPYIKQVLLGDIGLCSGVVEITDVQTGLARKPYDQSSCGDRFKILLPYAGHTIKWNVVFCTSKPHSAPDFSFNDDFLSDPDQEEIDNEVPSLAQWNYQDDKALLNVIKELFVMYKKYQVLMLNEHERLKLEYSLLTGEVKLSEDDIEVLIGGGSTLKKTRTTGSGINFLISLDVDFSGLPPGLSVVDNYGKNSAMLRVTFNNGEVTRISPELILSPNVEQVLGKSNAIYLPTFTVSDCLLYYVPEIVSNLNEKVQMVVKCFEKRKEYVAALIYKLGRSLLEYDSISFLYCFFLLEVKGFYFKLDVAVPPKFPMEKPTFTFRSVYHATAGKTFSQKVEDFPYSPKWESAVMVERALICIRDSVESFQIESVESAS